MSFGVAPAIGAYRKSLRKDEQGTTAVEFGLIIVPFIMLLLGIMSVCLYFFTTLYTENAVWAASRDLRTGALQNGTGLYGPQNGNNLTDPQKLEELKKSFCSRTPDSATCLSRIRMMVTVFTAGQTIAPPSCRDPSDNSKMKTITAANGQFDPGDANEVVMVTACFPWTLGASLPFLPMGNVTDGGASAYLVQASALFRNEPYK
jgi:Flp pilus assembly protein TadG